MRDNHQFLIAEKESVQNKNQTTLSSSNEELYELKSCFLKISQSQNFQPISVNSISRDFFCKNSRNESSSVEKNGWSKVQQETLLHLHNKEGNKWKNISSQMSHKPHNELKNYFYSKIRKAVRRINSLIQKKMSKQFKPLHLSHISKMITLLSEKECVLKNIHFFISENTKLIEEMKKLFFQYGDVVEGEDLRVEEIKKLRQFLKNVEYFQNSIKKLAPNGKKIKGRPTQKYLQFKKQQKSDEIHLSQKSVNNCSHNFTSKQQFQTNNILLNSSFFKIFCSQLLQHQQKLCEANSQTSIHNANYEKRSFMPYKN